jgi:uncharacterized surface protein with fasciclin (FAS1) repeats
MNKRTWLIAATSALTLLAAGCATTPAPKTVAEVAATTPELSTLNKLIGDAGLTATLSGPGPYTVFAPTNDAFKAVPPKTMENLAKDKTALVALLNYHVVPGQLTSADIKNGPAKTLQGGNLALSKSGTFVTVEDAVVTQADLKASNGVVQIIDRVFIPSTK